MRRKWEWKEEKCKKERETWKEKVDYNLIQLHGIIWLTLCVPQKFFCCHFHINFYFLVHLKWKKCKYSSSIKIPSFFRLHDQRCAGPLWYAFKDIEKGRKNKKKAAKPKNYLQIWEIFKTLERTRRCAQKSHILWNSKFLPVPLAAINTVNLNIH